MKRREFITLLGGAASAWPLAARAQQPAMPVIGFLNSGTFEGFAYRVKAFRQALNESGYAEGRNLAIEFRWAEDQYDQLPALAADLVGRQVALIVTNSPLVAQVAKAATTTIPILFAIGSDPIKDGLVASLNRPGGNLTGLTYLAVELAPKLLELVHEVAPAPTVAVLVNPNNAALAEPVARGVQAAADKLGLQLLALHASSERDFDTVFASLARARVGGLVIGPDPIFGTRVERLAALARQHALPAIYTDRRFAEAGGLLSYSTSFTDAWRQVGFYASRILKGERPADLPVHQATKVELVVNMKTANAFGLALPLALLGRADEVIE
jgi:putative ABC transport system substrate-binding protein